MKLVCALFVAVLSLVDCKQNDEWPVDTKMPKDKPQVIEFYDRTWSIDSATDSTFMSAAAGPKLVENEFYSTF
jgi:hypothetical protein